MGLASNLPCIDDAPEPHAERGHVQLHVRLGDLRRILAHLVRGTGYSRGTGTARGRGRGRSRGTGRVRDESLRTVTRESHKCARGVRLGLESW